MAPFLTVLIFLAVLNSFNMLDGHDGVAIVVILTSLVTIGLLYFLDSGAANEGYVVLMLLLGVTAIPFLFFNFREIVGGRHQLFLGDAGVMFLAIMICFLLAALSQGTLKGTSPAFSPALVPWIIGIPFVDMIAVILNRFRKRKRVSEGGREHIHHVLVDSGLSKLTVFLIIALMHGLCCAIAVLGHVQTWPDHFLAIGALVLGTIYVISRICMATEKSGGK